MSEIAIVGGGSWGTALALALGPRFRTVRMWVYEQDLAYRMQKQRENDLYLPGVRLPDNTQVFHSLPEVLIDVPIVLGVMPSHLARRMYGEMVPYIDRSAVMVSATKGIENKTLLRMSQVISEVLGPAFDSRIAVISGPTFAREVARGDPTALVAASTNHSLSVEIQKAFSGPFFRVYASQDPVGVEIGGSVKNVIAIGAGVCQGLGLGHNALAALMTRGLAEITRLAVAMGAQPLTLSGLAGLGDLVLTCTGELSRNRSVGVELAKGRTLAEITGAMKMIAEGVKTTAATVELGQRYGVDMPIASQMFSMLYENLPPREAVKNLMERTPTVE